MSYDDAAGKIMSLLGSMTAKERARVMRAARLVFPIAEEISDKRASAGRIGAAKRQSVAKQKPSKTSANDEQNDSKTDQDAGVFAGVLLSEGGKGGDLSLSDSQISDLGFGSPISSASLSNPGTSPGARAPEVQRPPGVADAGVLVHGALPPNADYMVSVYEAAVARAMGLPRWSMGTRRRDNAEAVARILDDWAWDDDGEPLPRGSPLREEWLRMNVEHYCANVVKPARGSEQAKFVTPSPNCFVRWLNETASARGGAQNDPDYEREEKQDRASGTRAAASRRALDSPEGASSIFGALAAKGGA